MAAATTKKVAKKKATKKKATTTKVAKKKATKKVAKKKAVKAADILGTALPKSLKAFSAQMRRDLNALEKLLVGSRKETRRSLGRIIRDASHQLGKFEGQGEREWKKLNTRAKKETEALIKKVKKTLKR